MYLNSAFSHQKYLTKNQPWKVFTYNLSHKTVNVVQENKYITHSMIFIGINVSCRHIFYL